MIPVGYMAKRVCKKPDSFLAPQVTDVYSVSACMNDDFADYIQFWRHNGFWLFDSPEIIRELANGNAIDLSGTSLFYYEVHETEFDGTKWRPFAPEASVETNIKLPPDKRLEGFDVVTFSAGTSPECSPLSCNGLADEIRTNCHCLLGSFELAKSCIESGRFAGVEREAYRIFAVYSVDWT